MKRTAHLTTKGDDRMAHVEVFANGKHGCERENTTITKFSAHKVAKWLEISIYRTYTDQPNARTQRQHSTLYEPEARALYETLRAIFEPSDSAA